jgi:hypothetical protein
MVVVHFYATEGRDLEEAPISRAEQNIKVLRELERGREAEESLLQKTMTLDTINPSILSFKAMEYAARGPVILRTLQIEQELLQVMEQMEINYCVSALLKRKVLISKHGNFKGILVKK